MALMLTPLTPLVTTRLLSASRMALRVFTTRLSKLLDLPAVFTFVVYPQLAFI